MKRRYLILTIAILLAVPVVATAWWWRQASTSAADKLATLLDWRPGQTIAEIGAGKGRMSIAAAGRVGPSGRVFSTELNAKRLAEIQTAVARRRLTNVTAILGAESSTNLPPACCDSIFMRDVYHHFRRPAEMDGSLFQALKPGGRLAVIDFRPGTLLSLFSPVNGVPRNRGGHGIPKDVLIEELTAAGFLVDAAPRDWPGYGYCVVLHKPEEQSNRRR